MRFKNTFRSQLDSPKVDGDRKLSPVNLPTLLFFFLFPQFHLIMFSAGLASVGQVLRGFKPLAILKSRFSDSDQISKTLFFVRSCRLFLLESMNFLCRRIRLSVESRNLKTKEQKICQSSDFIFLKFAGDKFCSLLFLLLVIEKKINGEPLKIFGESSIASCHNNSTFILCKRSRI